MIHGYGIISINHEGEGKLYDLPEGQKPFQFLNLEHDWIYEVDKDEVVDMLTPANYKDVLVMVFFSHHDRGGRGCFADDYEEWLEIEGVQILEEHHQSRYLENLQSIAKLFENSQDEKDMEDKEKVQKLIDEYEEFYDDEFSLDKTIPIPYITFLG